MRNDFSGAGQRLSSGSGSEPVAHLAYAPFRFASMRADILAGDVGNERAISIELTVENQGPLLALVVRAEPLATEKQPEFKRHVESRQSGDGIQLYGRKVVDSEPAFLDNTLDFRQSNLSGVILFTGASGDKPKVVNAKHNRFEHRHVIRVEGTINEDVIRSEPDSQLGSRSIRPDSLKCHVAYNPSNPARDPALLRWVLNLDRSVGAVIKNLTVFSMHHKLRAALLPCSYLSRSDCSPLSWESSCGGASSFDCPDSVAAIDVDRS